MSVRKLGLLLLSFTVGHPPASAQVSQRLCSHRGFQKQSQAVIVYRLKGSRRKQVAPVTLGGMRGGLTHMRYRCGPRRELGASRPHEEGLSHFFHFRHKAIRVSEFLELALAGEKVRPGTWAVPSG